MGIADDPSTIRCARTPRSRRRRSEQENAKSHRPDVKAFEATLRRAASAPRVPASTPDLPSTTIRHVRHPRAPGQSAQQPSVTASSACRRNHPAPRVGRNSSAGTGQRTATASARSKPPAANQFVALVSAQPGAHDGEASVRRPLQQPSHDLRVARYETRAFVTWPAFHQRHAAQAATNPHRGTTAE